MKVDILIMLKQKITRLFAKILTAIGLKEQNELYYIGGAETLPPPHSQEEETEILNRLLNNDESVRKILIEIQTYPEPQVFRAIRRLPKSLYLP